MLAKAYKKAGGGYKWNLTGDKKQL
jgi:hypothetical protein